ncbi:MAG: heme-copper oxidase subunit III, partial [Sphaerospermopsis kisseleviana]
MQSQIANTTIIEQNRHGAVDAHHEAHPDHRLFGLVVFLIAEGMIFMGMFGAYLAFRSTLPVWPPEGTPELELLLPGVNTINLIASSFVMHKGQSAIRNNDVKGLQFWFTLTTIMGFIFLGGQ